MQITAPFVWLARLLEDEVLLALLLACLALQGGCNGCGNDVYAEVPGPENGLKAVVFRRDCGATTGFSTHVALLRMEDRLPAQPGNVFIADDDHGAARTLPQNVLDLEVKWLSKDHLSISYPSKARVFLKKEELSGVSVEYHPLDGQR